MVASETLTIRKRQNWAHRWGLAVSSGLMGVGAVGFAIAGSWALATVFLVTSVLHLTNHLYQPFAATLSAQGVRVSRRAGETTWGWSELRSVVVRDGSSALGTSLVLRKDWWVNSIGAGIEAPDFTEDRWDDSVRRVLTWAGEADVEITVKGDNADRWSDIAT